MKSKCLCANDLKTRVTVQKNTPTVANDGQKVEGWLTVFTRWAKVTAKGAMERRVFDQLRAECDYLVQMRWSREALGIKPADYRFVLKDDGDKVLNIGGAYDPDMQHTELQFHCTEVVV